MLFLDGIIQPMNTRFTDGQFIKGFSVVSAVMKEKENSWREEFREFCTLYENDLPWLHFVDAEIDLRERR